jgi:hypothetical protein
MFSCDFCQKDYSSYQSLWRHKKEKHNKTINNTNNQGEISLVIFKCVFCASTFTKNYNLNKHISKFHPINTIEKFQEPLRHVKQTKELLTLETNDKTNIMAPSNVQQEMNGDHNIMLASNSQLLQNSNNTINNNITNNNTINNNQNINQNININIVPLGHENLSDILSTKEQMYILNKKLQCLDYLVEYIHLNDKYPQFKNLLVKDLKSNKALTYSEDKDEFITIKKSDLMDTLIETRLNDIEYFYSNNETKLKPLTKNIIENFINKVCNEFENPKSKFMKDKKEDLEILLYNERSKIGSIDETKKHKPKLKLKKNS